MAIKRIDLNEFVDQGYLQELNRRFLHPLGMALEMVADKSGKVTGFGGVWDYRDNPEGMEFHPDIMDRVFFEKFRNVQKEWNSRVSARKNILGYLFQPIPLPGLPEVNSGMAGMGYKLGVYSHPPKITIKTHLVIGDPNSVKDLENYPAIFEVKRGDWFIFGIFYGKMELQYLLGIHEEFLESNHSWKTHPTKIPFFDSLTMADRDDFLKEMDVHRLVGRKYPAPNGPEGFEVQFSEIDDEVVGAKIDIS